MLAELYRQQAALFQAQGAPGDEVEGNLQLAMATAQRQAARLLELRAATDLARLWAQGGERERARDLLRSVCDRFQDGMSLPDMRDARDVLNTVP